ncbi:MAG: capsule biosynthesis GfcC family protein [Moraxellaceae bacterium]|nr:capsule biosynthesis GfcC family protein [Moraxellaceae bacterium]
MKRFLGVMLVTMLAANLAACNPVLKGVGDGLLLATGIGQAPLEEKATNPNFGYLKVSSGPEALFVLGFREHGREAWFGAGPMALTITNGVVTSSAGIGDDLAHHVSAGPAAAYFNAGLHTLPANQPVQLQRTRSVLAGIQQHTQQYELVLVREEQVKVWAGKRLPLLRIEERPVSSQNNEVTWPGAVYWVSPDTGDMVASEQWLTPTRRFALVPREAQKLLPQPEHDQPLQAVSLTEEMRLSNVLRSDPRWQQQPVVAVYSQAKLPQAKRLQRGLLIDIRMAEASLNNADQRAVLQRLHAQIQALPVAGRWALPQIDPYWLDASPARNPVLAAGDKLVPQMADAPVTVITPNGVICKQAYKPQLSVRDYLTACDVGKVSHGVLVAANGSVNQLALGLWNRQPTPSVDPGAVIATPIKGLPVAATEELAKLWWMESLQ